MHQTRGASPPGRPHLGFANPEILGDPPEEEPDINHGPVEHGEPDPRYTGHCEVWDVTGYIDPEVVKEMEAEERAIWLGKWFGLQYAAWVSKFNMKELETYEINLDEQRDKLVGAVPQLMWTFRRFRVLEDEWRSPLFHTAVRTLLYCEPLFPSHSSSFGLASGASATKLCQPFAHMPSAYSV